MEMDRLGRRLVGPCLIWEGTKHNGYGTTWDPDAGKAGSNIRVHRLLYEMFVGPIEHQLDHLCRVRACASPAHLEDVTGAENTARADRHRPSEVITHCKRGHELNSENARTEDRGDSTARVCRVCDNEKNRAAYRRRREEAGLRVGEKKTHCPQGHPYFGDNLVVSSKGFRQCRECAREACRRSYHKRKQLAKA